MKTAKLLGILLVFLCSFAIVGCDSDEVYFKSKCTAVVNGQTYYDQLPLKYMINPSTTMSPSIEYHENYMVFSTRLSKERGGSPVYYVDINLFINSSESLSGKEYYFEKVDIDYTDGKPSHWEYVEYCREHRIAYADVNNEIVDKGSFRFTSYDDEKKEYSGTFTLQSGEDTMQGEFTLFPEF